MALDGPVSPPYDFRAEKILNWYLAKVESGRRMNWYSTEKIQASSVVRYVRFNQRPEYPLVL